ncbi:hypothetical protein ABPG75_001706 [Micractinium tetrahymenae]
MANPYCAPEKDGDGNLVPGGYMCAPCPFSVCGPHTCCPAANPACIGGQCLPCGGGSSTRCDSKRHQVWNNALQQCECSADYTNCGTTTLDCQKCCAPAVECGSACCDASKGQICDATTDPENPTCVCDATAPTPLKNCAADGESLDCKACCSPLCEWKDLSGVGHSQCCDSDQPNVGCYPEKGVYCKACAASYRCCPNNPELGYSRCCPGTNDGCPGGQYVCERSADGQPYDCVLNGCHLFTDCIENQTPSGNSHVCKVKQNNGLGDCDACTADNNLPCPEDYVCNNGKCKYAKACGATGDCPHGFVCTSQVCTVVPACTSTADCPVGLACKNGGCT